VNDIALTTPIEDPGGGLDPLQFTLRASVESGTLTVRHLAGDAVPLERLSVFAGDGTDPIGQGTLEPGGSVTADVSGSSGDTVRVIYSYPNADATTVVAEG
jgi:hypothetical protein